VAGILVAFLFLAILNLGYYFYPLQWSLLFRIHLGSYFIYLSRLVSGRPGPSYDLQPDFLEHCFVSGGGVVWRAGPGFGDEIIKLIKYSSLPCFVSALEFIGATKIVANFSFIYIELLYLVGFCYPGLITLVTWLLHRLEQA